MATLLPTTYRDFNDCHATEELQEVEGLALSRATVRRRRGGAGAGTVGNDGLHRAGIPHGGDDAPAATAGTGSAAPGR